MKSIEKQQEIIDNYVNGNISDFKRQLPRLTKKEVVALLDLMIDGYGIADAREVVDRYL